MVANIRGYTPNYGFKLINFDTPRWHTHEYANWSQLDSMFLQLGTPPVRGEWLNSTLYVVGDRVLDGQTGDLYRCLVQHTSTPLGTFEEDRIANPTYWTLQVLGVPLFRGDWTPASVYALGDIVVVNTYDYYLCVTSHTSSATFPPDNAFWETVFSATNVVLSIEASAQLAADSAAAAQASADLASNSAASAAASADAATSAQSAFRWLFDTSLVVGDPGLGNVRFNNADPLNITQLVLSAQSADPGNPDVSNWIITWDDSTNTTSRGSLYVRKVDDPQQFIIFDVNGAVSDSGTWLQVSVMHVAHGGTINLGDPVSVAFTRTGNQGASGPGGGDMFSGNNLSDVADPVAAADNIGVGPTDTPTFVQVDISAATINTHAMTKGQADTALALKAPLASPVFTGTPTISTPIPADDYTTKIPTTSWVQDEISQGLGTIDLTPYAPKASPIFTGNPTAPTPAANDNDTSIATTAYVQGQGATANPAMNGAATPGVALKWAREDHIHPTDTTRAPLASPLFTGDPRAPTPSAGDNDTSIATTAYVTNAIATVAAPPVATSAEFIANVAGRSLSPNCVWGAASAYVLTDATTVQPDFSLGLDFYWLLGNTNRTLANPLNPKAGQKGVIYMVQDGSGNRNISGWGTAWKFAGGTKPTLTVTPGAYDVMSFVVYSASYIACSFLADVR